MEMGVPAAAAELGVTEEAIRVRLRNGELRGRRVRVGRRDRWFVDAADVATWKRHRLVAGAAVPGVTSLPSMVPGGVDTVESRGTAPVVPEGGRLPPVVPDGGGSVQAGSRDVLGRGVNVEERGGSDLEGELVRLRREVKVLRAALYELIGPDRWPVL